MIDIITEYLHTTDLNNYEGTMREGDRHDTSRRDMVGTEIPIVVLKVRRRDSPRRYHQEEDPTRKEDEKGRRKEFQSHREIETEKNE